MPGPEWGDGPACIGSVRLAGQFPGSQAGKPDKAAHSRPKVARLDKELKRAKRLVRDLMMDKELLEMRIARHQGEFPFPRRRSMP